MILVIGGDGLIGKTLVSRFLKEGLEVCQTTRRTERVSAQKGTFHLDLRDPPSAFPKGWEAVKTVVFLAAISRVDECRKNPELSEQINVKSVLTLAEPFLDRGVHCLFVSTNQVFSGKFAPTPADADPDPITLYGSQKARVETYFLKKAPQLSAIIRFSKVLEPLPPLFVNWAHALRTNEKIHPFRDMRMAPLALTTAVEALYRIAVLPKAPQKSGVFQLSGDQDLTYEALARLGFENFKTPSLIEPLLASEMGYTEKIPIATTLESSRAQALFDRPWPTSKETILECFKNVHAQV